VQGLIALGTQKELTQQVGEMESLLLTFEEGQETGRLTETVRQVPGVLQANSSDHQVCVFYRTWLYFTG
jgi:hypothetical protein